MNDITEFSILFVCTGNTCRSPMAEGIARRVASEYGANNLRIESAGISAGDGLPATDYAIAAAHHWDIDISSHRSRMLTRDIIDNASLILAMGAEHAEWIASIDRSLLSKTFLLKGFPAIFNPSQERVNDPIGGTLEQYNHTFLELDEVIRKIFHFIFDISQNK